MSTRFNQKRKIWKVLVDGSWKHYATERQLRRVMRKRGYDLLLVLPYTYHAIKIQ